MVDVATSRDDKRERIDESVKSTVHVAGEPDWRKRVIRRGRSFACERSAVK